MSKNPTVTTRMDTSAANIFKKQILFHLGLHNNIYLWYNNNNYCCSVYDLRIEDILLSKIVLNYRVEQE